VFYIFSVIYSICQDFYIDCIPMYACVLYIFSNIQYCILLKIYKTLAYIGIQSMLKSWQILYISENIWNTGIHRYTIYVEILTNTVYPVFYIFSVIYSICQDFNLDCMPMSACVLYMFSNILYLSRFQPRLYAYVCIYKTQADIGIQSRLKSWQILYITENI
jgi:hypothetical protein